MMGRCRINHRLIQGDTIVHRFQVHDMTCSHCAQTVERVIKAVDAKAEVAIDLATKDVTVVSGVEAAALLAAIADVGYTPKAMPTA
jgi:copper chaperone